MLDLDWIHKNLSRRIIELQMSLDQKKAKKRVWALGGINHLWNFFFFPLIDSMGLVILVYSVNFCPKDVCLTEDCVCMYFEQICVFFWKKDN